MVTVTGPEWRSLTRRVAVLVGQLQVGAIRTCPLETSRPRRSNTGAAVRGLLICFRCSVIAKAAAVATSRPRRVTDVRTRCKAARFYGPLVNEVEERSGPLDRCAGGARLVVRARLLQHH